MSDTTISEAISDERLAEIIKGCEGVTHGPWEADGVRNDGDYGSGEDAHSGFESYQVLAEVRGTSSAICDTINAGYQITEVHVESDEDGHHAWDEQGRKNLAHIAHLDPQTVLSLVTELQQHRAALPTEPTCRMCGCTWNNACFDDQRGSCSWIEDDLCSHCEESLQSGLRLLERPDGVDTVPISVVDLEQLLKMARWPAALGAQI